MSEDIEVKVEYDIERDENWEEYIDWYTITFGDDEEFAEQYEQLGQLNCEEECMWSDDYDECFERCMEEYRN